MKTIIKIIIKRIRKKNPQFFNILSYVAAGIMVLFFGGNMIYDLHGFLSASVVTMIYTICTTIIALGQFPVKDD